MMEQQTKYTITIIKWRESTMNIVYVQVFAVFHFVLCSYWFWLKFAHRKNSFFRIHLRFYISLALSLFFSLPFFVSHSIVQLSERPGQCKQKDVLRDVYFSLKRIAFTTLTVGLVLILSHHSLDYVIFEIPVASPNSFQFCVKICGFIVCAGRVYIYISMQNTFENISC